MVEIGRDRVSSVSVTYGRDVSTTPVAVVTGRKFTNEFTEQLYSYYSELSNGSAPDTITVGSSPFSYENKLGYNIAVIISGGTALTIKLNGTSVASGLTGTLHTIILRNNDTLSITYTDAPSLYYYKI